MTTSDLHGTATRSAHGRRAAMSKGDRRESALLDSVEELLATRPLAEITLADIASNIGLSRSSAYFYFDNKFALVEAAVLRVLDRLLETLRPRASHPEEPLAVTVDKYLLDCTTLWRGHAPLLGAAVNLLGQRPRLRAAWEKAMKEAAESLATVIANKRAQGQLPDTGDPQELALAIAWMAERSYYMLYSREHTTAEEEHLPAVLSSLILHGVGAGAT
ncbi:TetR/AcrR family transcriptional regulator [Streptomyces sp. NPDC057644]|uniref:TetR/AcrR family transcriptional regulator n=1 Tax=Streptomyces sp. NPDC057644 TaxID=3346191 RepID=UPI00368389D3